MRRPLIWFSGAFAAGCALTLRGILIPLLVTAIVLLGTAAAAKWFPRAFPLFLLAAGFFSGTAYTEAYHRYYADPIAQLENTSHDVTVTAADFADRYDEQQRIAVRVSGAQAGVWGSFRTLLYLPLTDEELQPGDSITAKVRFYQSDMREGFDRESYYRGQGVFVLASVRKDARVSIKQADRRPLSYYPKQFARNLRAVFAQHGTERQTAFWNALTTGDRSLLTVRDRDHLRKAGLSHVIALSGLHVGFLISFLLFVFGRRIGTALGIPTLIAFYFMVGWSPSVVRACIMYGVFLLGFWLRRRSDSLNSLFAALLVILLILPDALTSVGLQLSFASTLGILCFASRIQHAMERPAFVPKRLTRLYRVFTGAAACTVCSMVCTAPILLYHFGYLSVFSIVSNVLALWAVSVLFPLLVIGGIIGLWFPSAAGLVLTPAMWLTDYSYLIVDGTAAVPYGILYCESRFDLIFSVVVCAAAAVLLWKGRKKALLFGVPGLVLFTIGVCVLRGAVRNNDLNIAVLTEGRGQAIVVSCGDQAALIDCSGSGHHDAAEDVAAYLDWHGIDSLDLVVLTSVDQSHARNICTLLQNVPVEKMILPEKSYENRPPYPELMRELRAQNISFEKIAPEQETAVGDASLGLSVWGAVDRKLIARIRSDDLDIVTVHALTQRMLLDLTDAQPLHAETLLVSAQFSKESDNMRELLHRISPSRIVVESGWKSRSDYDGIPVINPYDTGQIEWRSKRT